MMYLLLQIIILAIIVWLALKILEVIPFPAGIAWLKQIIYWVILAIGAIYLIKIIFALLAMLGAVDLLPALVPSLALIR